MPTFEQSLNRLKSGTPLLDMAKKLLMGQESGTGDTAGTAQQPRAQQPKTQETPTVPAAPQPARGQTQARTWARPDTPILDYTKGFIEAGLLGPGERRGSRGNGYDPGLGSVQNAAQSGGSGKGGFGGSRSAAAQGPAAQTVKTADELLEESIAREWAAAGDEEELVQASRRPPRKKKTLAEREILDYDDFNNDLEPDLLPEDDDEDWDADLEPLADTGSAVKDELEKALKQIVLGNYTDNVTALGTAGQVLLGLIGLDTAADIRDLTYDLTNWEWTPGHIGQTLLDAIGFIPGIGVLKNADEVAAVLKGVLGNADAVLPVLKAITRHADEAGTMVKGAAKYGDEAGAVVKGLLGSTDEAAGALKKATAGAQGLLGSTDEAADLAGASRKAANAAEGAGTTAKAVAGEPDEIDKIIDAIWNSDDITGDAITEGAGDSLSSKIYTPVEYKGTVKVNGDVKDVSRRVYQRNDIDINYFDETTGLTNLERMQAGKPPIGTDGSPVELHHVLQQEAGPMAELREITHQQYYSQLHGLIENGASFRNNPLLNKQYNNFRYNYWKWRASLITGGK